MAILKKQLATLPLPSLFWRTSFCIAGITLAAYDYPLQQTLLACFGVGTLMVSWYLLKPLSKAKPALFLILFFQGGFMRTYWLTDQYRTLQATLLERSLHGTAEVESCTNSRRRYKTCLTLTITDLASGELPQPASLRLYLKQKISLLPGDRIRFKKLIIKKQRNTRFSWYLKKEGLVGSTYKNKLTYHLIERPYRSLKRYRETVRTGLITTLATSLSRRAYTLVAALFFGKKEPSVEFHHLRLQFIQWGIVHFLARSGLHVVVLMSLWLFCFRLIGIPFMIRHCMTLIALGIYYLLTWSSTSFLRAVVVFFIYQLGTLLGVTVNRLYILCLATLIILMINPLWAFFLDFQLSFGLTYALAFYAEITHQRAIRQE